MGIVLLTCFVGRRVLSLLNLRLPPVEGLTNRFDADSSPAGLDSYLGVLDGDKSKVRTVHLSPFRRLMCRLA